MSKSLQNIQKKRKKQAAQQIELLSTLIESIRTICEEINILINNEGYDYAYSKHMHMLEYTLLFALRTDTLTKASIKEVMRVVYFQLDTENYKSICRKLEISGFTF